MAVLIVEDEFLILDHLCSEFADAGLPALGAADAREALTVLEGHPGIEAMITDVNMPGNMDGIELASTVHARWPAVKIVVVSGRPVPDGGELPTGAVFVPKPYFPHELVRMIRRA